MNDETITSRTQQLLLVDDERMYLDALAFKLSKVGFQLKKAYGGQEAIELLKTEKFDVILCDVQMPDANGLEVLKHARQTLHDNPLFFLMSGFADISTDLAFDFGAEEILNKPIDIPFFKERIAHLTIPIAQRWKSTDESYESAVFLQTIVARISCENQVDSLILGKGGAFIPLRSDFPVAQELLNFKVTDASDKDFILEGIGQVKWVRQKKAENLEAGIGIKFFYLSDECRANILSRISSSAPTAYIPLGGTDNASRA